MRKTTIALLALLVASSLPAVASAQITSAASGSWTDGATWVGGLVPTSSQDVLIQAGHTISIDLVPAVCRNVTFGGNNALIDFNSNGLLTVYGDFTLFSTTHVAFSAGWSGTNAYIKFAGSAVQTLRGWSTSGGSTSFRDVIVDKDGGKLTTAGNNMRLGIQNSLEIVNGLFELAPSDDIEGRWASSGLFTSANLPNVTVRSGGEFSMLSGGAHHVRSNAGIAIGTVTVFGKATFIDASTLKIILRGIDVEDGGKLIVSTDMGGGEFDCGALRIKSGGELEHYTTSDCWGVSAVVTLDAGGLFDTKASTTLFPASFVNNGTVRYSREGTTDQTIVDMNYTRLEISLDPDNNKIWDLAGSRTIADTLKVNLDANLVLTAGAPQSLTVGSLLYLTSGQLDNSDPEVALTMANGSMIQRATGTITSAPAFAGLVDLRYTSTAAAVTTGPEVPAAAGVLDDFTLSGDQGVALGSNLLVGGVCTISGSDLTTGAFSVAMGPSATLVESSGTTVVGTVTASRDVAQGVGQTFGGLGLELTAAGAAPGLTDVVRTTTVTSAKDASEGVGRTFDVAAAVNTGLDATVVFHYDESELNSIPESSLALFSDNGSGWQQVGSSLDVSANTVTGSGLNSCSHLTLGAEGVVANLLQNLATVLRGSVVDLSWDTFGPIAVESFSVSRFEGNDGTAVPMGQAVVATGASSYRFVDETGEPGSSYRYRVEVAEGGSSWILFETAAIEIQRSPFALAQNNPNPFNPSTKIEFSLPKAGHVTLDIFDTAGRRVARLLDSVQAAGPHSEVWTGIDDAGNRVASGTYFYQMASDGSTLVKKMVLLK